MIKMELPSAFGERLEEMERTRNQRLSLLQAEKELQVSKSQILASKLADIRSTEQRCFVLDRNVASQRFKILALRSEIERLDSKYQADLHQLRVLRNEVEELEEVEKKKAEYYAVKGIEMKEFKENVENFVVACKMRVSELRTQLNELNSTLMKLQGSNSNGYLTNSEIADAEMRKLELLAIKERLDKLLGLNFQRRSQLEKQLRNLLEDKKSRQDCK